VILVTNEPQTKKNYTASIEQDSSSDLKFAIFWFVAGIVASYVPILNETPIKAVLLVPGILFLPGYCLVAALFPKSDDISIGERIALSIGLSIAIVPLIALLLNYTPFGIRQDPILIALTVFILVTILIAHYRRTLLSSKERFSVPFLEIKGTLLNTIFPKEGSRIDRFVKLVITLAFLAAILTTVYIIAVPKEGERFTEFFILGENRQASDYPDLIIAGQNYPIFIGLENHEYRKINYTIETWTMLTEFDNRTNSTTIIAMDTLNRLPVTLEHNETMILPYTLFLNKTGYNRIEFLLFNETIPGPKVTGSDRINASYKNLNLKVTIKSAE
jgi:uncharacterized membrane protein